ncbi:acetate--CoA ligase family protein [Marinobacter caseinilyticus]|uniref:acetate--CoA ligase family protein n=1 Tax=Marinobacter caseinilyticus TaxID=2692195 RepID=UPI00140E0C93|nr:acetate--CoA ligase family protein [Marinobacter caseinilyticus]
MGTDALDGLLSPEKIAIIGASDDTGKISGRPIEYLKRYGFQGEICPVNPRRETVQGLQCYPSIAAVPGTVDLAIIAIPGKSVIHALEECAEQHVRSCIIFSSGFAESGEEGKEIQRQISDIATQSGMRVLGPNCQGVVNLQQKSVASFSTCFAEAGLRTGYSAIISQSGAVAAMVYNLQKEWAGGIKYWIATGNEADVSVSELLDKVLDDTDVRVVQVYMEDVKKPSVLISAARKARHMAKPILALKSGKTPEGKKAASSHTGALAGEDAVVDAVFRQSGIVRVRDVHELANFPVLFSQQKRAVGRNVAILSNSGGLGVMMVDQCRELGLGLAKLSMSTIDELTNMLPDFASAENPIDLTAQLLNDKELLSNALPVLTRDPGVDIILFGLGIMGKGYDIPAIIRDIAEANRVSRQIMAVAWVGGQSGVIEEFSRADVPVFENATMCVNAVASFADFSLGLEVGSSEEQPRLGKTEGVVGSLEEYRACSVDGFLSEHKSKELLKKWGLPVSCEVLARTEAEAVGAASTIGYPVAVKICSAAVQHKTELGGLVLNVQNEQQLRSVTTDLLAKGAEHVGMDKVEGVLVQEMLQAGFEVSLGIKRDQIFGPVLMVASGGIYIEILKDFQLLIPPVDVPTAMHAIKNLVSSPILEGARGRDVLDTEALAELISSLSLMLVQEGSQVEELDINPVFVMKKGEGVRIVDALVRLNH